MKPPDSEKLHDLVAEGRFDRAVAILNRLAPVIAADAFMSLPYPQQEALFRQLPAELAAKLATIFPYYHSFVLLHTLAPDQMIAVFGKMNPIERTNFVDELPEKSWQQIVRELEAGRVSTPAGAETAAVQPIIEAR